MNTILIEPFPNNYVRCVLSDQSSVTMEAEKLPDFLKEHPMAVPTTPTVWSILNPFKRKE